jgi:predicted transcriptional regulator of viral defense system
MKTTLGPLETRFLAFVQLRRLRTVRLGEISGPLRLSRVQERKLLSRLSRAKMIARVRRGLYLVPPRLPLGGTWSPDEALALNTLMDEVKGRYQVCGPNAFSRYGLTEQLPARLYAYNNRVSGQRQIGSITLELIKVADSRLGDTVKVQAQDGAEIIYPTLARTLVDAVYDWSRFGGLPRAYGWISRALAAKRIAAADLVTATLRYGNQGTIRRIGVLLAREGASKPALSKLRKALRPSTGTIPWIPTLPKRGRLDRRWGVVVNEQD